MASIKPNLYFFGDSFVQWPEPELHWTERFSNEYTVHRMGSSGANFEHTLAQLGTLPQYVDGDRVVVVLTEFARHPKWIWGHHYGEFVDCMGAERANKRRTTIPYVKELMKTLVIRDETFEKRFEEFYQGRDNLGQFWNLLGRMYSLLGNFKPVYMTWNWHTYNMSPLPKDMLTYIDYKEFTSVSEERGEKREIDYHPGKEGGRVWYDTCKVLLDNWKPIPFQPEIIGTNYSKKKLAI